MGDLAGSMPGGDTRTSTYFTPFPIVVDRGDGYTIEDADGNEYIDLLNNFTSLVHGHAHPGITDAIARQVATGTCFSAPHRTQGALAERISDRIRSVESVRFTNSGTEAAMQAVRAARAITGRDLIVKARGGYHGSWEQVPTTPDDDLGTPAAVKALIQWVDFNDVAGLESVMSEYGSDIAAIVLEPVMGAGGVIKGTPEFFQAARRLSTAHGALMVVDEVITFRLTQGGYQEVLGIEPDLTVMGKVIGGGLPVGAIGGPSEVMDIFDPRKPSHLYHGGTFNGNPLTMVAGSASLDLLDSQQIDHINTLGEQVAKGLNDVLAGSELLGNVTYAGSLFQVHMGAEAAISSFADVDLAHPLLARLHTAGLEEGLYFARRGLACLSTVMTADVAVDIVERFARAVERVVETSDIEHAVS